MIVYLLRVLIESDWNLKSDKIDIKSQKEHVLIESDWNLKIDLSNVFVVWSCSINRIRLEFKGVLCLNTLSHTHKY